MEKIHFLNEDGTFSMERPENYSYLYLPIAGERGLKSSVAPDFGGDSKINQESFLLEPVSVENLHNNRSTRNFWVKVEGKGCWSVTGASAEQEAVKFTGEQDESELTAGFMWQTVKRKSAKYDLEAEVSVFIPVWENVEIMSVRIWNRGQKSREVSAVAAVPLYGRSADNIRDHRNVTSMLHRIRTEDYGVLVKPAMSFDEKGHRRNHLTYFAAGGGEGEEKPLSFYPSVIRFIGEGGTFTHPAALYGDAPGVPSGTGVDGKEAMGGIRFEKRALAPGESMEYVILTGITDRPDASGEMNRLVSEFGSYDQAQKELGKTKEYWQKKVGVKFYTGSSRFDFFMRWVCFQPYLRYLYGCSFLPCHDYGRGGRGWRDLWQDCLSLLLVNPEGIRQVMADNYGGVRLDGSNATIIGSGQGEFVADRNGISRVWMDHGLWPFMTTKLYLDQTGDYGFLLEKAPYFKDALCCRGTSRDEDWHEDYGMVQKTASGDVYYGTVLEHILIENLCEFYETGEHNMMRLRGADWNDALDMAEENGESVAFTCAYAGNLTQLAECLREMGRRLSCGKVRLLKEMNILLGEDGSVYESPEKKREVLKEYMERCRHAVSGETMEISLEELVSGLERKADWLTGHIRRQEWIAAGDGEGWFNSYYDNSRRRVEGITENGVRMMLIGQVFAIMSGTADDKQVKQICKSADHYLYNASVGGYRLNTDFRELKFDMGRMFGFAYGQKENGAVFSHMTVMYANALYKRGFAREGYLALKSLADTALDFDTSRIYPGIPEYFDSEGRGMYPYLTGAASWYMMTMLTEVFGVHGVSGDLCICPKLVKEQFDGSGMSSVSFTFAGKEFTAVFQNPKGLSYGEYKIQGAELDGFGVETEDGSYVMLGRKAIDELSADCHKIVIELA